MVPRGWGSREMNKQNTEHFYGSENILYEIIMEGTCHYTPIQTHKMYSTQSEP